MVPFYTSLPNRAVLSITGDDRVSFLQGLLTNDIAALAPDKMLYALLLTPQGRFLHDMFLFQDKSGTLHLDIEASRQDDLLRRLTLYKLRSRVAWTVTTTKAYAVIEGTSSQSATILRHTGENRCPIWFLKENGIPAFAGMTDPRKEALGKRLYVSANQTGETEIFLRQAGFRPGSWEDYDAWRIRQGVPDGSRDMPPEKALPLDYGLDILNAISWTKGCYVGQEVTARMHYRGQPRKALTVLEGPGPWPPPGSPLEGGGEIRTSCGKYALGLLPIALTSP